MNGGTNQTYIFEGWPGWIYLTLALLAFTAYHFIPRNVSPAERRSIYRLFGTLGPGPVLIFLIRFFGTDHIILVVSMVLVTHEIIPPYTWLAYMMLVIEFFVASCAVTVSYVVWRSRKERFQRDTWTHEDRK